MNRIVDPNLGGIQYDEKLKQEVMRGPEASMKKLSDIETAKKKLQKAKTIIASSKPVS